MWTSTLDELTPSDIQRLVDEQTEESTSMEFKERLPSNGDEDTREFLYDVSAMANGGGGYLVFGIADMRDSLNKPTGVASKISGIKSTNLSSEIARLESKIRDGVAPRLGGMYTKVLLCGDEAVVVLSIPKSWNAPHMVTFRGANKFFGRVSTGKYPMSVDQIRTAFSQQSTLGEAIRAWRRQRTALIKNNSSPVELQVGPTAIIQVIPASAFSIQSAQSSWKLGQQLRLQMHCPSVRFSGSGRYNADGYLKFADAGPGQPITGYTQVFRNAIIEYVTAYFSWGSNGAPDGESPIFTQYIEQELVKATRDARATYKELEIKEPFYVGVDLRAC